MLLRNPLLAPLETVVRTTAFVGIYRGFFGGAKWKSSIHSMGYHE